MQNLSKIMKVKIPPFAILISGLVIVSLLSAIGGILHYGSELKNNSEIVISDAPGKPDDLTQNTKGRNNKNNNGPNYINNGSNNVFGAYSSSSPTQASNSASDKSAAAALSENKISYVKVSLSVNSSLKGSVSLKSTANQCEVLTQAKAQGVIGSLIMKYNDALNSYGVYVIEGIGRTDQVYWTYTVNGKPPPLGCSYVTVHGGDSINWQYIN